MDELELQQIRAARLPVYERSLIEIPPEDIVPHYSSLTDYLDNAFDESPKMLSKIDHLVMDYRLGAVEKLMQGHFGTILPRINQRGMIVGGNAIFFDVDKGSVLYRDLLTDHLAIHCAFDYYVDSNVFFGEHLYRGKQTAIVQEEKSALLGRLAHPEINWLAVGVGKNLTDAMMNKFYGHQVILFPDDFCYEYWSENFGSKFKVDDCFTQRDINQYLIDTIRNRDGP